MLLVVDYAESREDLVELLRRLARYAEAPGPRHRIRMLLLARSDGDWWTELQKRSDVIGALLRRAAPIALSPLVTTALDRDAVFAETAAVFATMRGKSASCATRRSPSRIRGLIACSTCTWRRSPR